MRGSISGLFYIMNHNNKNLSFEIREIQRTDLDEVYQMLLDLIKHDNLEDKFKSVDKTFWIGVSILATLIGKIIAEHVGLK